MPLLTDRSVRNPNVTFELGFARRLARAGCLRFDFSAGERPAVPTDLSGQVVIQAQGIIFLKCVKEGLESEIAIQESCVLRV